MDHEQDADVGRLVSLAVAAVFFAASAWFTFGELRYAIWGREVEARIVSVVETAEYRGRRSGGDVPVKIVEYIFQETDGPGRREKDRVSIDWTPPESGTVVVEYVPGRKDASRLAGKSYVVAVLVFVGSLAVLVVAAAKFWLDSTAEMSGKRRVRV
jgi:hypothetical protein